MLFRCYIDFQARWVFSSQALHLKFKMHGILLGTGVVMALFNKCLSCLWRCNYILKNGKLLFWATIAVLKILQNQYEFVLSTCLSELMILMFLGRGF